MSIVAVSSDERGRAAGTRRAAMQMLLGAAPVALTAWLAFSAIRHQWVAFDFTRAYYPAATRLLHHGSPYAVTHAAIVAGSAFVYPALSAVAFVPFALFKPVLGDHLYMLLCFLCVIGTLGVLRVRDWRVYGATLLWMPIIVAWQGENISAPLTFLVALAWRNRNRPLMAGLLIAAAISLKPFIWPLALWLLATRRWRAAVWALAWGVGLNLLAWWIVGFNEIHVYLHLSGEVTDALWRGGYSSLALAHHLGLGRGGAEVMLAVVTVAVGARLLYTGLYQCREMEAMVLSVALMLVASPLVWNHYFALLMVPLAISRPRFSLVWTAPIAMWLLPPATAVALWQIALAWLLAAGCFAGALRPAGRATIGAASRLAVAGQVLGGRMLD